MTWEAEEGRSLSLSTKQSSGQSRLHTEILSWKTKQKKEKGQKEKQ